jgi:dolichyl-diphosphooligosaccharide--protein glycosyltransferase
MLTLTPIVCIAAALVFSQVLETFNTNQLKPAKGKSESTTSIVKTIMNLPILFVLVTFAWHCSFVTSTAYSSPSVVLASNDKNGNRVIVDDFREAYYWLRQNVSYN